MTDRVINAPGPQFEDIWVYNTHATLTIERGHICSWHTAADTLKIPGGSDPFRISEPPLDEISTTRVVGVNPSESAGTVANVAGIAQQPIKPGDWGQIRTLGPGVVEVAADTFAHMDAICSSTTAGRGTNVANILTDYCCAVAIGADQVAAAGDLIQVLIQVPTILNALNRYGGTWTDGPT